MTVKALARDLAAIVGDRAVVTDRDILTQFGHDNTGRAKWLPQAAIRPGTIHDLAQAVHYLTAIARVPMIPQGGNTGRVLGGVPGPPEAYSYPPVVISTRALTGLSLRGHTVSADAGVPLAGIDEIAGSIGCRFNLHIGAQGTATVGGATSTNAKGPMALRYGSMMQQLTDAVVILPGGDIATGPGDLPERFSGRTLPEIFGGSEGTLGLIARVTVALSPQSARRATALLGVAGVDRAVQITRRLKANPAIEAIELMMGDTVPDGMQFIRREAHLPPLLGFITPVYLLVEASGDETAMEQFETMIGGLISDRGPALDAIGPVYTDSERAALWRYRHAYSEVPSAHAPVLALDVGMALRNYAVFTEVIPRIVHAICPGARVVQFGHLGAGSQHILVTGAGDLAEDVEAAVLDQVLELHGRPSEEHGTGREKIPWVWRSLSRATRSRLLADKAALDPDNLCNPGVRLPAA